MARGQWKSCLLIEHRPVGVGSEVLGEVLHLLDECGPRAVEVLLID